MPYPQPFIQVAINGDYATAGDEDKWSIGFKLTRPGLTTGAALEFEAFSFAESLRTPLGLFFADPGSAIRSDARVRSIKANAIGVDGKYLDRETTFEVFVDAGIINGYLTPVYPKQVALVATLATAQMRGLAKAGRIFFPTAAPYDPASRGLSQATTSTFAGKVAGLINAVNSSASNFDAGMAVSVMSQERTGAWNRVNAVRVGNRLDIQRRRDNAEEEVYSTAGLVLDGA